MQDKYQRNQTDMQFMTIPCIILYDMNTNEQAVRHRMVMR